MTWALSGRRVTAAKILLGAALFLLPWQTRWIYAQRLIDGAAFEYGQLSVYAVEGLILLAALALGRPQRAAALAKSAGGGFVFLGTCFIATSFAWDAPTATAQLLHLSAAAALFLILLDERLSRTEAIWAGCLGLVAPCLLGWWQTLSGASAASTLLGLGAHAAGTLGQAVVELADGERLLRAYGSFTHPNVLGGYLAAALLLLPKLRPAGQRQRWAVTAMEILFGATLVITFSRSAWLGLLIGLIIWQWPAGQARRATAAPEKKYLLTMLTVGVAVAAIFAQAMFVRLDAQSRLETKSVVERANDYQTWGEVWRRNPFAGVGPGVYPLALAAVAPQQPAWSYQPIHNFFLLALAEVGLIGLCGLSWWLAQTGKMFWAAARRKNYWPAALAAGLLPPALLDHYLWSNWSGLALLTLILALAVRDAGAES